MRYQDDWPTNEHLAGDDHPVLDENRSVIAEAPHVLVENRAAAAAAVCLVLVRVVLVLGAGCLVLGARCCVLGAGCCASGPF